MEVNYVLQFEKHGAIRPTAGVLDYEIWLDVGNALEPGCIDHHQTEGYPSALDALLKNLPYLSGLKKSAEAGHSITVHLHNYPDVDSLGCFYVTKYYLEHTEEEFREAFGPEGNARAFVDYVNTIDSGRGKETGYPTLYALFCSINAEGEDVIKVSRRVADIGLKLMEIALSELMKNPELNLFTFDMSAFIKPDWAIDIDRFGAYEREKQDGTVHFERIPLWRKDGTLDSGVLSAIWQKIPADGNGYNNARKEGCFLTVVPFHIKGEVSRFGGSEPSVKTSVTVSLDPEKDPEYRYSLKPMAEVLEQLEQMEEQLIYDETGSFERDHSRARTNEGSMSLRPFSVTSNPWYIAANEDIVASPRGGSLLRYEDILAIIRNNGCMVKNSYMIAIAAEEDPAVIYDAHTVSISRWQREVKERIHEGKSYKIIFGEVDASLICHNNRILKAYCMSMVDRSLDECGDEEIHFVDYRTCIYEDYNCMIILTATSGEDYGMTAISKILDKSNAENFVNSRLIQKLMLLPKWRYELIDYGHMLGLGDVRKRRQLEEINDSLLHLSAEIQSESLIQSNLLSSIYSFAKEQMHIEEMKTEVMEEASVLVNESRERLVSSFNIIMSIATPFALIDILFEAGMIQIDPLIEVSGLWRYLGWGITGLVCLLMILLMFVISNRKRSKKKKRDKKKK